MRGLRARFASRLRRRREQALRARLGSHVTPEQPTHEAVSRLLWERAGPGAEERVLADLGPDERRLVESAGSERERRYLLLALGTHHGTEGLEATGLTADEPPAAVHAMARGPVAAGGTPYYADLVEGSLRAAGLPFANGLTALDFGCSSGRVVRVLRAALPGVRWMGCDPNAPAIEWARDHLPGIDFFASPTRPPLDLPSATLDRVLAISVWSHHDQGPALDWLAEMRRLVRQGGALLLTTHGPHAIARAAREGPWPLDLVQEIAERVAVEGFAWFAGPFAEPGGDWGVSDPGWGFSYMSAEWLAARVTPDWSVRLHAPGAVEGDQDLWVLRRR